MTVSKLSAGDGYAYYVRQTVSADVHRDRGQELGDYYLATGMPAGVWVGSGTATLGVAGEVSEAQMKNLFGAGMHPEMEATMEALIAAGASEQEAVKGARLGRSYARFQSPSSELAVALSGAVERAERIKGGALDPGERRAVRHKTAAVMFRERMGREATNPIELTRWMGQELSKGQQPVAGFDCTFSAPKSVSVLWATGDEQTRMVVENAHEAAMNDALAYLEQHAAVSRVGAGGARQVAVEGLVGTRFRHWTSREGDPQLHDHMVISNKVRRADMEPEASPTDGWVTLDGQTFYRHIRSASTVYDRALADHMRAAGYAMENRAEPGSNKLKMEVVGISDQTIQEFSGRRIQILTRTDELVEQWEAEHRTPATKVVRTELAQQATLETRSAKDHAETLAAVQADARARLAQRLPTPADGPSVEDQDADPATVGARLVADMAARRSHWSDAHLEMAINQWAASHQATPELMEKVREQVERHCVKLTPESSAPGILRPAKRITWYTSTAVMDAENTVLDAADHLVLPSVSSSVFDATLAAYQGPVDEGQVALARAFACGEHLVEAGIGPAGAGKTTAMQLTVQAVEEAGHRVIGLATSARAAEVFTTDTGAFATSLAMWTTARSGGRIRPEYELHAGDVIVVDEASMASTQHLAQVVDDARRAGAFVRLLGDPAQLGAVEAGGLLRELDRRHGATRLESLWRFRDVEEAAATTRLSTAGDVDWYLTHDRVHGVRPDELPQQVMAEWFTHMRAGRQVAVMASTNVEVDALNKAAQQLMREAGLVDHNRTVTLRGGAVAGVGDVILTRTVDRRLTTHTGRDFVRNGDRWRVEAIGDDGSVQAVGDTGRRITLPATYLRASTQLGYASTVHAAQGRTVDHGLFVATDATDRNALYVGLTRGRLDNHVYVPLTGRTAEQVVTAAASRSSTSLSAHEIMAREQAAVDDPAQAIRAFRVVVAETDRPRFDAHIRATYTGLYGPGRELDAANAADALIQAESRAALDNALRRGEAAGFSVERLITATAPEKITDAHDPARLVAWRIDQHLAASSRTPSAASAASDQASRPLASYSDQRLSDLAARAAADKTHAQQVLVHARAEARTTPVPVTMKDGTQMPAWTDRPHGHLTRDELSAALDDTMAALTDTTAQVRDARREVRAADIQWRLANCDGQRLDPATMAAAEHLAAARDRLDAAREADRLVRSDYAELRGELQIRRHMSGKSWAIETRSRDEAAARQNTPASRYIEPAEAQQHRYTTHADIETAHNALARARLIDAQVRAEHAARLRVPDQAKPYRYELPTWAGASNALHDPIVAATRRAELTDAAQWINQHITRRGEAIALDPTTTPWARELGPIPDDADLRQRWTQLAGRIDTYRQLAGYTEPDKSLPTAGRGTRQSTEIHTMRAALSDLRHDTTQTLHEQQAREQQAREQNDGIGSWNLFAGKTATITVRPTSVEEPDTPTRQSPTQADRRQQPDHSPTIEQSSPSSTQRPHTEQPPTQRRDNPNATAQQERARAEQQRREQQQRIEQQRRQGPTRRM